jgi:hypothetical protein
MGVRGCFPETKRSRREADHAPSSSARVETAGAIGPLTRTSSNFQYLDHAHNTNFTQICLLFISIVGLYVNVSGIPVEHSRTKFDSFFHYVCLSLHKPCTDPLLHITTFEVEFEVSISLKMHAMNLVRSGRTS